MRRDSRWRRCVSLLCPASIIAKNLAYPVSSRVVSAAVTSEAARLHAEPVSVFPALGELFDLLAAAGCSALCTRPYHFTKIAWILGPYVHFTAADLGRFAVKRRPSGRRRTEEPLGDHSHGRHEDFSDACHHFRSRRRRACLVCSPDNSDGYRYGREGSVAMTLA